jgi:TonB family protein
MRISFRLLLLGVFSVPGSVLAQNAPAHREIPAMLPMMLSAKLDANVRTSVAAAIDAAHIAYTNAADAHALQPRMADAVIAAHAAAAKAEDGIWGYGVDDLDFERYAGEMKDGVLQQAASVEVIHPHGKENATIETDGTYAQVKAVDGGLMYVRKGFPDLVEYFAADGSYFAGYAMVRTVPALPPLKNGTGVFDPDASKPESEMAGQFHDDQLEGNAIVRMRDGGIIAGFWSYGKLNGYAAKFDSRGHVVEQGLYSSGLPLKADFDAPAPGLTLPVLVASRDCNEEFYPAISVRLHEEGDVDVIFVVSQTGEPLTFGILKSTGSPRLEDAAMRCIGAWRYAPAQFNGKPVSYLTNVTLQMRILHPVRGTGP